MPQSHPLGATFSYCNTGYVILGRVIEQLTGAVGDAALAEHLAAPLGLTQTWTLPEDVLRFRAAMGHVTGSPGEEPQPASSWYEMRSLGPAGLVCATAADAAAFARLHLDDGRAPDGTRVLAASTVAKMQHPQAAVPAPANQRDDGLLAATLDTIAVVGPLPASRSCTWTPATTTSRVGRS